MYAIQVAGGRFRHSRLTRLRPLGERKPWRSTDRHTAWSAEVSAATVTIITAAAPTTAASATWRSTSASRSISVSVSLRMIIPLYGAVARDGQLHGWRVSLARTPRLMDDP